jgi:hypothetical protein
VSCWLVKYGGSYGSSTEPSFIDIFNILVEETKTNDGIVCKSVLSKLKQKTGMSDKYTVWGMFQNSISILSLVLMIEEFKLEEI